ncbi:hypothetical protein B0H16DRAFT_1711503 [Mycena metata]|uniref:NAD(P)-binding protein n=1 Tax=Mycena metata TaxID=1033252 RepID=A0AAD7K861_9AGAR|nr:hypothetical protein B0H16DRAFT_1711503 [Mycena metata]
MSSQTVALVTGAAQGIGRAIALRLAEDGLDVAVNDIASNSESLDTLVDEIQKKGRKSSKFIADVSQEEAVKQMVEQVVKDHGGLDVMVANAGVAGKNLPFVEVSGEEWDRVMNVNGKGVFLCYKYAGIQMVKQGRGGRILGASSVAGKQGVGTQAAYSASKFAVRGLTQAAALEFGPHGITVNAYAPGAIDTPMLKSEPEIRDAIIKEYTQRSPVRQIGVPGDIASLVSFLVKKEAQFITGQKSTKATDFEDPGRFSDSQLGLLIPSHSNSAFADITEIVRCKGDGVIDGNIWLPSTPMSSFPSPTSLFSHLDFPSASLSVESPVKLSSPVLAAAKPQVRLGRLESLSVAKFSKTLSSQTPQIPQFQGQDFFFIPIPDLKPSNLGQV